MTEKKIRSIVEKVISGVRKNGDKALVHFAKRYDKITLSSRTLRVPKKRFDQAWSRVSPDVRRAIEACGRRIQDFHYQEKKHLPESWTYVKDGVRLGQIFSPMKAVGIYVPGGRFAYPSTLLMTAIPARLAGVERIVVATPPTRLSDNILAAAKVAGVDEIYQVGGPAAIAALALGTKTIPKVDLIVGPGNALVTEAKRQLFGEVGIDMLAGPSELIILADKTANPEWVAADLAAQAEHDPDSKAILVSLSKPLIADVKKQLPPSLTKQCVLIYEPDRKKAIEAANQFTAEHVELVLERPQDCLDVVKNGGAFFVGPWSTAVMGDYWAGPSHVLPTGRSARFASGLSVMTFIRRASLIDVSSRAFQKGAPAVQKMAEVEGLTEHAKAVLIRQARMTGV